MPSLGVVFCSRSAPFTVQRRVVAHLYRLQAILTTCLDAFGEVSILVLFVRPLIIILQQMPLQMMGRPILRKQVRHQYPNKYPSTSHSNFPDWLFPIPLVSDRRCEHVCRYTILGHKDHYIQHHCLLHDQLVPQWWGILDVPFVQLHGVSCLARPIPDVRSTVHQFLCCISPGCALHSEHDTGNICSIASRA